MSRNLLPLHHLHKIGGNMNIKTLNGVSTKTHKWRDHQWKNHKWCIRRFSHGVSLTGNSDSLVSDV